MESATTEKQLVKTEDRGHVRHILINRPEKRNAIDYAVTNGLAEAFRAAAHDPDVHCVVLGGTGEIFSAGADLNILVELSEQPQLLREFRGLLLSTWNMLEEMTKPTIAQVQGGCIGGALELILACDLRVAAEDAFLGIPETKIGLIPDVGGSSRLPSLVGLGRAKELIMTGKIINGREGERIGLINRIAPAAELEATTETLVEEVLACAPLAVGLAKRVMDASAKPALAATLEQEVTAQQSLVGTEDFAEGARAALEKRPPEFKRR